MEPLPMLSKLIHWSLFIGVTLLFLLLGLFCALYEGLDAFWQQAKLVGLDLYREWRKELGFPS